MFCTQCGTRNGSDARFCKQCGHKLDRTPPLKISEEDFEVPASPDEKVRDLLLAAYQKYEAGDLQAAVATCAEALEIRPGSTDAHSLMSTLHEKMGDREKAIVERERVLELNPGSIADREKLDELRDGQVSIAAMRPGKITTSRRSTQSALIDSPKAQALVAIAVMLIVFSVGVGAMVWAVRQNHQAQASSTPRQSAASTAERSAASGIAPGAALQPPATDQPSVYHSPAVPIAPPQQTSNARIASTADQMTPYRRQPAQRNEVTPLTAHPLGPAPINSPNPSGAGRMGAGALPDRGSVMLPDTGPDTAPGTTVPTNDSGAPQRTAARTQPPPSQGKVEIIVSPGPAANDGAGSRQASSSDNANNGASLDSRSTLEVARDLHARQQYAKAVTFYRRALDGAGDRAADIHQQIAICYQRLNEKESAISHYQQAIDAYRAQIAAGRNVDAAKSAIRACQNGIKVCQ